MSAAHGRSRALLETGIWLQPPRQPPAQARAQDEATNTYEWPGSCGSRRGTSASPQYFSRFYLQTHYWQWENKDIVLLCWGTCCPARVEPQPSEEW